jgi:hypothetical protein
VAKGHINFLWRVSAFLLLSAAVLSLGGCARPDAGIENTVVCNDDIYTSYPEIISRILPSHTVEINNNRAFQYLEQGAAAEAFDPQAVSALRANAANYWYPHYLATVIIAADRGRTDAEISGWNDLQAIKDNVGVGSALGANPRVNNNMIMAAISFGLEGENYTLKKATELLSAIWQEGRLINNSLDQPVFICYDFQAARMKKSGFNIEIIIPAEGTLTYEKGLLSNTELTFGGDTGELLAAGGFRLTDGRCDAALYPDAVAYGNAYRVSDYDRFVAVTQNVTRTLRRDVVKTRMYSSKDNRQHQYWVLLYVSVVVVWMASLLRRITHKNIKKTVLLAGGLLMGWLLARLISYQLDVNTDFRRYVNYTYFLFQLPISITFIWLAHIVGKNEGKIPAPLWIKAFAVYIFALIALAYTNDIHNLLFTYDFTTPYWADTESYGIIYTAIQRSWELSFAAALIIMMIKSEGGIRKRGLLFPFLFVAVFAAYQFGYQNNIPIARESDITMVTGIFILCFVESLVRAGMIPVNTKYNTLFAHSPLDMRIIDIEGNPALASTSAMQYDADLLDRALKAQPSPVRQDKDTLLFSTRIAGGYAVWQEDISAINRLYREIEESLQKLKTANEMLAEEEKVSRAAHEENEKTQVMVGLEAEISAHTIKLSTMMEQLETVTDRPKAMARITLLICYIKRCCNRFFQAREITFLSADELTVYLDELAEIAGYSGVKTIVTSELKSKLPFVHASLLYDFFYNVIYWATWLDSPQILVHLGAENGAVVLRLLPSGDAHSFQMDRYLENAIAASGGVYAVKDLDDDTAGLSLSFPEGGDGDA